MKKRLLVSLAILIFISLACQISFTPQVWATTTPVRPTFSPTAAAPTTVPTLTPTPLRSPTPTPVSTTAPQALPTTIAPTPIVLPAGGEQPVQITGSFTYTNTFAVETYYVEQAVALIDMHGFVIRDKDWVLPVDSQVIGFLKIDKAKKQGDYQLHLPEIPSGVFNDFTNSGGKQPGVQVFAVAYQPNTTGGPFSEGDDASRGWPSYLTSMKTDAENKDEVIGGKLVVWAPDAQEQFPTGFGTDGLLFTADDPLGSLPAGYSIVDLDQKPFQLDRSTSPKLVLYEPKDVALKDFSGLSYSAAFQNLFDTLKKEYAFNGVKGKEPDWDKLYADVMPQVKQAEAAKDPKAYYAALLNFSLGFKDGHVSIDGGDVGNAYFSQLIAGGYGFAIRELDDGRVIVVYVTRNGPAQAAGMEVGAEVTQFNGQPIKDAIGQTQLFAPQSSDFALRYQQTRYLTRAPIGTSAQVTFQNKNGASKTVSLKAVNERQSFSATSLYRYFDSTALPVEYQIFNTGVGYIRINSNYDDLNLIVRIFQRALQTFQDNQIDSLIIDLRVNSGGAPLGLAGFLTNKEIVMGTLEYYSDKTGKFEPEGEPDKFTPNEEQYKFKKMALLVDQACFSACELEAYGFSKVPGMIVVGMVPTGGVEAEVSRGQFKLPEGMSAQFPTGRFVLPDGSLFLEGQGVKPTVRVPITEENVLSQDDVVLTEAENQVK